MPLPREVVQKILATLGLAEFRWQIRIDNLALVSDDGTVQKPVATFRLAGT